MRHTFYATFDDPKDAAGAIADLEHADEARNHCSEGAYLDHLATGSGTKTPPDMSFCHELVHRDLTSGAELESGETAFRHGLLTGILGGGVGGGLVTAAIVGALIPGAALGAAALGAVLGAAYGAFMGGISAANGPDPKLEKLAGELRDGQVVVTVETPDLMTETEAEAIVERHHGTPAQRARV